MKPNKKISILLIVFLFTSLFTGTQLFMTQKATAIESLMQVNQNPLYTLSAAKTPDGKLIISNTANSGGFSSGGITNTSYLITADKISGDFTVETTLKVTGRTITGTGGVVGVGAFGGTGENDLLVAAVARGDGGARSYYKKADGTYGAGSPNISDASAIGTLIELKLERTNSKYYAYINDQSKDLTVNEASETSDMHLGLVICGATAEVESFVIKQGATVLYDLSEASEPSGPPPVPASISAMQDEHDDSVVHIEWTGDDLTPTTSYFIEASKDEGVNYTTVTNYTYADYIDSLSFSHTYNLTESGSYVFKVTGISGGNKSEPVVSSPPVSYVLPLGRPVLTVTQDSGVIYLSWTAVPEATHYGLTVMDGSGDVLNDLCVSSIEGTSHNLTNLTDGAVYKFSVTSYRGEESNSSEVSDPVTYIADYIPTEPEWQYRIFGSSTDLVNNAVTVNDDGSVTVESLNGKGKISSTVDGIAFYYTPWDSTKGFQLTAKARVETFVPGNNQRAFGLMLRNTVGVHGDSSGHASNLAAAGAEHQEMVAFYKAGAPDATAFSRISLINKIPADGDEYTLRIIKNEDNTAIACVDSEYAVIDTTGMFTENKFYIGLFAARDAKVTFSDIEFVTNAAGVTIDSLPDKTTYLLGEELDLTGLSVSAQLDDGSSKALNPKDYVVTGFDSESTGTQTLTVNYGGKTASFDVEVIPLTCLEIEIEYPPVKTTYYLNDPFDPAGMVITGTFNSGLVRPLEEGEYTLSGFDSTTAGDKEIIITLNEDPSITASFTITVKAAELIGLEITKPPEKTIYFIGEGGPDLDGIVVYANYSDGAHIRLERTDYSVSGFDTSSPGEIELLITYKGMSAVLKLTVKEKELVGIEITGYPKTTYNIGESFDSAGLEVSKSYDNGDREIMAADEFTLDSSAFDSSNAGTYDIVIIPADSNIEPITFSVTVREESAVEWNFIRFGQSTSNERNYYSIKDDGTIELVALEGGGKITGDHDGISFYYTVIDAEDDNFVLSADIKVISYAKDPHDGQESFGLMARDAIGNAGDSSIFASNIAAVGGYSGGTRNPNGTQLFIRTGVESPDGAGSQGVQRIMLRDGKPVTENTYPAVPYRLTLAKTNSGYVGKINDEPEQIFYEPDILNVQDSKIYVGFYTARLATIEVSNIEFNVTAAESDPPRVEPPAAAVEPYFEFISLDKVSKPDYNLMLKANVDGVFSIKQDSEFILRDIEVNGGETLTVPTAITPNGITKFSAVFLPDDTQYLTCYDKIVNNFSVTMKTYLGDIYVSPSGTSSGAGTINDPLDIDTAVSFVGEGQKIVLLDGVYKRSSMLEIKKYNDGTKDNMKYFVAAPGAKPVIDFDKKSEGVVLSGNYWYFKGIDFARSQGNTKGFTIGGSHNVVELCRFYENGDTGLQISRTDIYENDKTKWPSHNLILNCTSFDNRDPSENNADGFAAKLTCWEGNVFRGCIAHNNIDDGWDLYTKAGTGAIGPVVIENCIAYNNGSLTDGTEGKGDKNGFKLGGEGIHVPHIIKNSVAFGNGAAGFTSNSNPGVIARNNVAYQNEINLVLSTYSGIPEDFTLNGFISYMGGNKDSYPDYLKSDSNFMFDGSVSKNKSGRIFTDSDFSELTSSMSIERDGNGNIKWGNFWTKFNRIVRRITPGSDSGSSPSASKPTPTPSPAPEPVISTTGTAVISPDTGGTVGLDEGITIVIPQGALTGESSVQVTITKVSEPPAVQSNQKLVSTVYELTIDDSGSYEFGEKIILTFTFDQGILEPGMTVSVYYYDENKNQWIEIGGVVSGNTITVEIDHFTKFAVIAARKTPVFNDIAGHWAEQNIYEMAAMGVVNGLPDGSFQPDRTVTRAEFAKMLIEAYKLEPQAGKVFNDTAAHWAKDYIATAYYYKIINGYSESVFGPDDHITREQAAAMIIRASGLPLSSGTASISDLADVSDWAEDAVKTAVIEGIIPLYDDKTYRPVNYVNRAEAVTYILNSLKQRSIPE